MRYSAVIATRYLEGFAFSIENLLANSVSCEEVIVVWDGDDRSLEDASIVRFNLSKKYGTRIYLLRKQIGQDVYGMFNTGVSHAIEDFVLLFTDDMYVPTEWDKSLDLLDRINIDLSQTVITCKLVESGYVDVASQNIKKDFGKTIQEFDQKGFDSYARSNPDEEVFFCAQLKGEEPSIGWYMPSIFSKELFTKLGMFPTYPPYPNPNDMIFFERMKQMKDIIFVQLNSKVYHFQLLSSRVKQIEITIPKLNLCCGDDKKSGYLNVDIHNSDHDVDVSKGVLPFQNGSFEEILFKHAIEHFQYEIGLKILEEIYRVLKPNGYVDIFAPELATACEDYLTGENEFPNCCDSILRLYGQNTSIELVHKWGYTAKLKRSNNIVSILENLGFKNVVAIPTRDADEFGVRAFK